MATTKVSGDAGSKNWLKERAAISAAHRRQKTDPAVARLIEKADQLHKERTKRHLHESADGSNEEETDEVPEPEVIVEGRDRRPIVNNPLRRSVLFSSTLKVSPMPAEDEGEDIDEIVNVPPPEEIVVKVAPKNPHGEETESRHDKGTTEEVYRSFAESVLEQGLTTESSLELSFDLKPEDIKEAAVSDYSEEEEEEEEEEEKEEEEEEEEEEQEEKLDNEDIDQLGNEEEKESKADSVDSENLDDDEFEHIEKEETNKDSPIEEVVVVDIATASENNG